jgi:hypothetical protein
MKMKTFLVLSLMLIMAGCIPTLTVQPLWSKQQVVSEPALEGRWISPEGDTILRFTSQPKDEYRLNFGSEDGVTDYEAHLIRLDGHLILDLSLEQDALDRLVKGQAFAPILPMHFFAKIRIEGNRLYLGLLHEEEMEKEIDAGVVKVPYSKTPDGVILTGSTAELQEAVGKLAGIAEVWDESVMYRASTVLEPSTGK